MLSAKQQVLKKLLHSRNKRKIEKQKNDLPNFISNPALLVNMKVKHLCRDPGKEAEWLGALVTDITKKKTNALSTCYSVRYDDFPDETWSFELLRDMKSGDLVIN